MIFSTPGSSTDEFLGGRRWPQALLPPTSNPPPQITIPLLTLPPQHFWVGPKKHTHTSLPLLVSAETRSHLPLPHPDNTGAPRGFSGKPIFLTKQVSVCAEG